MKHLISLGCEIREDYRTPIAGFPTRRARRAGGGSLASIGISGAQKARRAHAAVKRRPKSERASERERARLENNTYNGALRRQAGNSGD